MSTFSYDKVYKVHAWRDNNRLFSLTQGEGTESIHDDAYAKSMRFQLIDEAGAVSIGSNAIVEIAATRPDDKILTITSATISSSDAENGFVSFPVKPALTEVPGVVRGEIRMITANSVIKFFGICWEVHEGAAPNQITHNKKLSDYARDANNPPELISNAGSIVNTVRVEYAEFPYATKIEAYAFYGDTSIMKIDLHMCASIGDQSFGSCEKFDTIVIRSSGVCTLGTNVFSRTKLTGANPTGYIYVPSELVNSYKAATNWSTYASRIKSYYIANNELERASLLADSDIPDDAMIIRPYITSGFKDSHTIKSASLQS